MTDKINNLKNKYQGSEPMHKETEQWNKKDINFFRWTTRIIITCIFMSIIGAILSSDADDQITLVGNIYANAETVMEFEQSTERTEYLLFVKSILNDSAISRYEKLKESSMFTDAADADEVKKLKTLKSDLTEKLNDVIE